MVTAGPTEPVVHPNESLNDFNCNVERCTVSWEVDPEIGYRV